MVKSVFWGFWPVDWQTAFCITIRKKPLIQAGSRPHSVHLPPATSRGPFFFFSSCSASVNSFPPFFSSAEPVSGERTVVITSSHADRQTDRWRAGRSRGYVAHTGGQAWAHTDWKASRQRCCPSFHLASLWILSCSPVSVALFDRLGKSVIGAKMQSCYFSNNVMFVQLIQVNPSRERLKLSFWRDMSRSTGEARARLIRNSERREVIQVIEELSLKTGRGENQEEEGQRLKESSALKAHTATVSGV